MKKKFLAAALSLGLVGATVPAPVQANDEGQEGKGFKHDRSLAPPAKTTGNGVAAGTCEIGVFNGTTT
jgi:hypothetical protein